MAQATRALVRPRILSGLRRAWCCRSRTSPSGCSSNRDRHSSRWRADRVAADCKRPLGIRFRSEQPVAVRRRGGTVPRNRALTRRDRDCRPIAGITSANPKVPSRRGSRDELIEYLLARHPKGIVKVVAFRFRYPGVQRESEVLRIILDQLARDERCPDAGSSGDERPTESHRQRRGCGTG